MPRPLALLAAALALLTLPEPVASQALETSWRPDGRVVINRDVGLLIGLGGERLLRDSTGDIVAMSGIRIERSSEVGAWALAGWAERRLSPRLGVAATSEFSGVEVLRWFGIGNETPRRGGQPVRTSGNLVAMTTELIVGAHRDRSVGIGFAARHHSFHRAADDSLSGLPGIATFSIAGPTLRWTHIDRTDGSSLSIEAAAGWYPLSLDRTGGDFADLSLTAAWLHHVTDDSVLSVATKLHTTRLIGEAPFQEMARLGGGPWLRGYQRDRFIGDIGMAAAGAELHLRLGSIDSLTGRDISGTIGALAFVDAGRVWHSGERSSRWHQATGIGLWLKPHGSRFGLDDAPRIYGALVRAEGRFALDGGVGVRF